MDDRQRGCMVIITIFLTGFCFGMLYGVAML